ncbi:MAG: EscU/YscU/HrcU family type III secretion system export apparatus switch protein [Phycisphaerae bacterium]|jgi:flagellar biosynthetic protein FlhB|nr:EscU/YscU/HrcU family type III secretion system export apparatus switch protein [Phycisphaerae bacterium]
MATRSDTDQRTEQPTVLRLAEARRRGQVARSADLTGVAVILAAVVAFWLGGEVLLRELTKMFDSMLSFERSTPDVGTAAGSALWSAAGPVTWITVCFCALMVLVAALAGIAQVGLHVSEEVAKPRLDRLSPGQGLKRIFSSRGLAGAMLALTKIAAVGFVAWMTIDQLLPEIALACGFGVERQWIGAWAMLGRMAWRILLVLAVLGGIDWLYQWRRHRRDLMMTRREVLEDLRKTEGDPLMRSRRRRARQAEMKTGQTGSGDES